AKVRGSLRQCLESSTTREWYLALRDDERRELSGSTDSLCRVLRRDFRLRTAVLEMKASKERFRWTQSRQATEYAAKKVWLLRMAGIKDEKRVIEEVHAGFVHAPELQGLLETKVDSCESVSEYRTAVSRF